MCYFTCMLIKLMMNNILEPRSNSIFYRTGSLREFPCMSSKNFGQTSWRSTRLLISNYSIRHFRLLIYERRCCWLRMQLSWRSSSSDDVRELGFTVVIDMRGSSTWNTVKPILKVLQEYFANSIHTAYLIKPDNFWQKQRTSLGSQKYKFEVTTWWHWMI